MLVFVYTIISLGAIVIDAFDFYGYICPRINFTFEATLYYCVTLLLTMVPFYFFQDEKIQRVEVIRKLKVTDCIVCVHFVAFFLLAIFLYKDIIRNQAMLALDPNMKHHFRFGYEAYFTYRGAFAPIIKFLRNLSAGSINLLFLFFYYTCIAKRSKKFCIITLIGSMCILWDSLLILDRSKFVYWAMTFVACYVFFKDSMDERLKEGIKKFLCAAEFLITIYVLFMNMARFSNGTENGITNFFSYIGQSFINFCTFYEKIELQNYSIHGIFPILNHFFPTSDYNTWYRMTESSFGVFSMCFSTFVGEMISEIGKAFTLIWTACFGMFGLMLVKRRKNEYITLPKLFGVLLLYNV
ncbi:oligosaccharide repeat unit polymerase, partial [Candidatus Saccharibacteria bacterium]|nr:oligosaccharide repeat unit polymerase [Candidatus Saccharibacteria bacterium]